MSQHNSLGKWQLIGMSWCAASHHTPRPSIVCASEQLDNGTAPSQLTWAMVCLSCHPHHCHHLLSLLSQKADVYVPWGRRLSWRVQAFESVSTSLAQWISFVTVTGWAVRVLINDDNKLTLSRFSVLSVCLYVISHWGGTEAKEGRYAGLWTSGKCGQPTTLSCQALWVLLVQMVSTYSAEYVDYRLKKR